MKPLLLCLLTLLLSTRVPAQKGDDVVQEVETTDRYLFRLELERGKASALMQCTTELTDGNVRLRMGGKLTYPVDDHAELYVDTRRRLLTIEHSGSEPAERTRVKELAARAKVCLDAPATPAPPPAKRTRNLRSIETEMDDDTRYTYSLRDSEIDTKELVRAFAEVASVTVNARFTGDWTTADDDGIEYSLDTRRHLIRIDYRGDDATVTERTKEKVRVLRARLRVATDAAETTKEG